MKVQHQVALIVGTVAITLSTLGEGVGAQGAANADQVVASLKANLQESQKQLRKYQWIETTTISLKGEVKSRKQEQVYYGADGTLTKVPMAGDPQPQATSGGRLKERVVEKKKDEMEEYMERAKNLIHQYVPPNPAQIQKAKDAGTMVLRPLGQGNVSVEFPGFVQPGDRLSIEVVTASSSLANVNVQTYLDKPEDAVTLDASYSKLPDGTNCAAQTTLNAKAKNITVVVQNTGHRPLAVP